MLGGGLGSISGRLMQAVSRTTGRGTGAWWGSSRSLIAGSVPSATGQAAPRYQPLQPSYNPSPSGTRNPCPFRSLARILHPAGSYVPRQGTTHDGGWAWAPTVSEPGLPSPRSETP